MIQKKRRPPDAASSGGPRIDRKLNNGQINTPKPARPQAPDDAGESDLDYFTARPSANVRVRLPFPNEFAPGVLDPGRAAYVRIAIERDAYGQPKRRARRRLRFCDAGTA